MIRIRTYLLCLSVVCLSWVRGVEAEQLPQYAPQDHLGVATCASGVCHGSVRAREATAVSQNEYVIWSRRDRHRAAYNTLLTDQSKSIAKNLGLKNAHEADMCLDCHADNVAVENRGERLQIDDGVGCEACHGGSETYISTHVDDAATHASNIEDGLYPSDDPRARAKLCLSCHLGTSEKMANHNIMGAGHPRISFELDTFNWLQPAHYNLDEDYRAEKWAGSSLELWTIGQVEAARQTLGLIKDRLNNASLFPELALFDCHACHHSMSDQRWAAGGSSLPPGSVRLNDANFVMLFSIANVVDQNLEQALRQSLAKLHKVVNKGQNIDAAISQFQQRLDELDVKITNGSIKNHADALVKVIIEKSGRSKMLDYGSAEQALMAVDMLLSSTGMRQDYAAWLDKAYDTLSDENAFDSGRFTRVMRSFKG